MMMMMMMMKRSSHTSARPPAGVSLARCGNRIMHPSTARCTMHILILHYTLHTAYFTIASDCTEHFPQLCNAMCIFTLYKCTSCSLASTISTGLKCNSLNTAHCLCHWIGCNADETPAMYSSKTNIASLTQVRVSSLLLIYVHCTICALLPTEKTQP